MCYLIMTQKYKMYLPILENNAYTNCYKNIK